MTSMNEESNATSLCSQQNLVVFCEELLFGKEFATSPHTCGFSVVRICNSGSTLFKTDDQNRGFPPSTIGVHIG